MRDLALRWAIVFAACLMGIASVAPARAAAAAPRYHGVDIHVLYGESDADTQHELDLASDLNANLVRISVNWSGLEPYAKGEYATWYLDRLDAAVAGAQRRGMKVLLQPFATPCWASSAPEEVRRGCPRSGLDWHVTAYAPVDPGDLADLARMLVARYGGALAAFEVWNEPNLVGFLNPSEGKTAAEQYVAMLKATDTAIKAVDPHLTVLAGALSGSDAAFYAQMRAAGAAGYYDALSVHPYNGDRPPTATLPASQIAASLAQGLPALRAAALAAGDDAPIWATELGYETSDVRGGAPWENGVSLDDQARWLAQSIQMLGDEPWIEAAMVYGVRDLGSDPDDPQQNFGLVTNAYEPKPSFAAVRRAFGGGPAAPVAPAGAAVPEPGPSTTSEPTAAPASEPVATAPAAARATGPRIVMTATPRRTAKRVKWATHRHRKRHRSRSHVPVRR